MIILSPYVFLDILLSFSSVWPLNKFVTRYNSKSAAILTKVQTFSHMKTIIRRSIHVAIIVYNTCLIISKPRKHRHATLCYMKSSLMKPRVYYSLSNYVATLAGLSPRRHYSVFDNAWLRYRFFHFYSSFSKCKKRMVQILLIISEITGTQNNPRQFSLRCGNIDRALKCVELFTGENFSLLRLGK